MEDADIESNIPNTSSLRKNRLILLGEKRKKCFSYLKDLYGGGHLWLKCIRFSGEEITKFSDVSISSNRTLYFFYFGLSLAKLVDQKSGVTLVRAVTQLLEEWEYYTASFSVQSMKYVMARNTLFAFSQNAPQDSDSGLLCKFNNDIIYQHLLTPSVSFDTDFIEVISSLCEIVTSLYDTLLRDDDCYVNTDIFAAIIRNDRRIQKQVTEPIITDLSELARQRITAEIDSIRTGTDCRGGTS